MTIDLLAIGKLLFLAGAGFVASFYGASVGGGSLVTIPALIFIGLPLPLVIATNRFAVVWGELSAFLNFKRTTAMDIRFPILCGAIGSLGAFVGSRIVLTIDRDLLNLIVAGLLVFLIFFLALRKNWGKGESALSREHRIFVLCCMPFIGFYAGFFGAAHGVFTLILLTAGGLRFLESAMATRFIGLMIAITAALSFWQAGVIQWPESFALAGGFIIGGWAGARFSAKRNAGFMRWLLMTVALASALKLLWDVVG